MNSNYSHWSCPSGSVKNCLPVPASAGDLGSIPESGGSPGAGNDNLLQYSWMETPWAEEPGNYSPLGLCKSWTLLSDSAPLTPIIHTSILFTLGYSGLSWSITNHKISCGLYLESVMGQAPPTRYLLAVCLKETKETVVWEPELKHSLILSLPIFSYSLLSKPTSLYFQLFQICGNRKGKSKVLRMTCKAAMALLPDSWMTSSAPTACSQAVPLSQKYHCFTHRWGLPALQSMPLPHTPCWECSLLLVTGGHPGQFHEPGQAASTVELPSPAESLLPCVSIALDVSP